MSKGDICEAGAGDEKRGPKQIRMFLTPRGEEVGKEKGRARDTG